MRCCGPWLLLLLLTVLGFAIRSRLEPLIAGMVYWFLWATLVLLGVALAIAERGGAAKIEDRGSRIEGGWRGILRPWLAPLVAGVVLTTATFLSVEPAFRVLADETNQLDASLSLYLDRALRLVTQGSYHYGGFHPILAEPSHRPGFYPFCINVLHTFFGYSGYHGFVVNFIASALTLAVVVRFGQKLLNLGFGLIAAVLLASFPLFSWTVTSSAFEPVNMLLVALVFHQLHRFLEKPDGLQLEILLLLTVLASQCRYETVLLILPVAVACYWKRHSLAGARLSWRLAVIPLLFLPVIWQRIARGATGLAPVTGETELFSLGYLWRHALNAVEFYLNPAFKPYPSSPLIFVLALIGAGMLLKAWFSRNGSVRLEPRFAGLLALGLGLIAAAQFSYSWGDFRPVYTTRLATVYLPAICLAAAYPLYRLCQRPGMAALLAMLLAGLLAHGLAVAAKNEHGNTLTLSREYKRNLEFLKAYPRDGTLVIAERPGMYAGHLYGAVNLSYANKNAEKLLTGMRQHLYNTILVIQRVRYKDQQPEAKLGPKFVVTTVLEYQNGSDHFLRISKVLPPPLRPVVPSPTIHPPRPAASPATTEAQKRYFETMKKTAESRQPSAPISPSSKK